MPDERVTPDALIDDISDTIEFLTDVAKERGDLGRLGSVFEQLSTQYRVLGICLLSAEGDVQAFFEYLAQSALARRYYLQGVAQGGGDEAHYRRASFLDPAFDAIAARQWRVAEDVLRLVAQEWSEGEEYEDDFCYAEFVRRVLTVPADGFDDLFARWEAVLQGATDPRLNVARALGSGSAAEFEATLLALLVEIERSAAEMADPATGSAIANEDDAFFPNRWVSVEGLALLAIAGRLGVVTTEEFPACPPLARRGQMSGFRSKGYPNVPYRAE